MPFISTSILMCNLRILGVIKCASELSVQIQESYTTPTSKFFKKQWFGFMSCHTRSLTQRVFGQEEDKTKNQKKSRISSSISHFSEINTSSRSDFWECLIPNSSSHKWFIPKSKGLSFFQMSYSISSNSHMETSFQSYWICFRISILIT